MLGQDDSDNTPAYYDMELITAVKSFMVQALHPLLLLLLWLLHCGEVLLYKRSII
jgi:hypothetical protein